MESLINSFLIVFASEMGDKTQLLALILVARFKKPWTILFGVFIATILNHALAAYTGGWISSFFSPDTLKWILAFIFFLFAAWVLIPDKADDIQSNSKFGALSTTIILFFLAEMGDKTQLATVALGAHYATGAVAHSADFIKVTIGTTFGMMASNALAIFMGEKFLKLVPMKWTRIGASILFVAFGIGVIFGF